MHFFSINICPITGKLLDNEVADFVEHSLQSIGQWLQTAMFAGIYHKTPKNLDTRKITVIILKLEQYRFATE